MTLRERIKWWSAISVVGLLAVIVTFAYQTRFQEMQTHVTLLEEEKLALIDEYKHLRYLNGLAMEFSMDPKIVGLVDHFSRLHVRPHLPEWRLLRTPEFMTYVMLSLIWAESKGDANAVGDAGKARGLTQIWVSTAKQYGEVTAAQLLDAETNLSFAFKHFHYLLDKYKGNLALVLYAWNRGPGTVDRLLKYGESPENGYAKRVYEAALLGNRQTITAD